MLPQREQCRKCSSPDLPKRNATDNHESLIIASGALNFAPGQDARPDEVKVLLEEH